MGKKQNYVGVNSRVKIPLSKDEFDNLLEIYVLLLDLKYIINISSKKLKSKINV